MSPLIEKEKLTYPHALRYLQEALGQEVKESEIYCCAKSGEPFAVAFSDTKEYYCRCEDEEGKFRRIYLDGHDHRCK